jgi:inosine-uridine nucleoside N-ribohydrolase
MNNQKIIIDTDPGKDDVLALMLAYLSRKFDIQAITTVAGNATIQDVTNNARFTLDLLGSSAPLYSGAAKPLRRRLQTGRVMGDSGLGGIHVPKKEPLNGLAISKIREIIRANPGEITILAIGPLTNIAKAFQEDPKLPSLLKNIVIMGGSLGKGNTNRVAEFNFFTDPDSASIVFQSNVEKVLIPLDLCYTVPFLLRDFKQLKETSYFRMIWKLVDSFIEYLSLYEGQQGAIIYDALAVYYALKPTAFVLEPLDILIETQGELTRGMCVIEARSYIQKNPNVLVAMDVNRQQFKTDFFNILKNQ